MQTRCGVRRDDLSVAGAAASGSCSRLHPIDQRCGERVDNGDGTWSAFCIPPDAFLLAHCAPTHCERSWPASGRCNAECFSGAGAAFGADNASSVQFINASSSRANGSAIIGCLLAPSGAVLAATERGYDPFDAMASDFVEHFVFVYLGIALAIVAVGLLAACECCWQRSRQTAVRRLSLAISSCFVALAAAVRSCDLSSDLKTCCLYSWWLLVIFSHQSLFSRLRVQMRVLGC
eukprot:SAG11_NODE_3_length_39220_cov_67.005828_28_plen_234_part_00